MSKENKKLAINLTNRYANDANAMQEITGKRSTEITTYSSTEIAACV